MAVVKVMHFTRRVRFCIVVQAAYVRTNLAFPFCYHFFLQTAFVGLFLQFITQILCG